MASKLCLQLFLLLAFITPHLTSARHLHNHKPSRLLFSEHLIGSSKNDNIVEGIHKVKAYLQRYGYFNNENDNNLSTDAFDDRLESAIKLYQKFSNLKVSGVLDRETLQQMSKPRCGVRDTFASIAQQEHENKNTNIEIGGSRYTFFFNNVSWPAERKHLSYGFIHNYPPQFVDPLLRAFQTWEDNTKFSFFLAPRVQTADILVSFERGAHGDYQAFDGEGGILAHSLGAIDGRVHFDADEAWERIPIEQRVDLESVAFTNFSLFLC
ncbi:metalloendoproteinase 5-MMP-like [Cucumis melo var. makuwa]|uniref:Metalloendoproteinase 5-MMP-like n=1 Tax=Cucumis melo var. makuwa TaxID=1194695 RepID=A0A5D3BQ92_CUCMM|nr:metalloendoproteinase 5-MMP-like [Cucumis melo var. makuwa]